MSDRLITMRDTSAIVALSKSEIYRRIKAGTFPGPIRIGSQRIAFLESDIDKWITDQRRGSTARQDSKTTDRPRNSQQ